MPLCKWFRFETPPTMYLYQVAPSLSRSYLFSLFLSLFFSLCFKRIIRAYVEWRMFSEFSLMTQRVLEVAMSTPFTLVDGRKTRSVKEYVHFFQIFFYTGLYRCSASICCAFFSCFLHTISKFPYVQLII